MTLFETQADRDNERDVASTFGSAMGVRVGVTRTLSDVDFYGYAGTELVYVGEVKCRNVASDQYGSVYFDHEKADKLLAHAREYGASGVVVLRYTDGVFWMPVEDLVMYPTRFANRTDRGVDRPQAAHIVPPHALRRIA